jgi:hypothetical protein
MSKTSLNLAPLNYFFSFWWPLCLINIMKISWIDISANLTIFEHFAQAKFTHSWCTHAFLQSSVPLHMFFLLPLTISQINLRQIVSCHQCSGIDIIITLGSCSFSNYKLVKCWLLKVKTYYFQFNLMQFVNFSTNIPMSSEIVHFITETNSTKNILL